MVTDWLELVTFQLNWGERYGWLGGGNGIFHPGRQYIINPFTSDIIPLRGCNSSMIYEGWRHEEDKCAFIFYESYNFILWKLLSGFHILKRRTAITPHPQQDALWKDWKVQGNDISQCKYCHHFIFLRSSELIPSTNNESWWMSNFIFPDKMTAASYFRYCIISDNQHTCRCGERPGVGVGAMYSGTPISMS